MRGVSNMKIRKMLSAFLAAVMVFALICTPAFAAEPSEALDALREGGIWIDVKDDSGVQKEISVDLLYWIPNNGVFTRDENAVKDIELTVLELPLGVTLAAGPNCQLLDRIFVYSDPDKDGVYELRVEKYTESTGTAGARAEIMPLTEKGPLKDNDSESYFAVFDWGYGSNAIQCLINGEATGYRTVTTDHLVDMFGPDTLLRFTSEENENLSLNILLTGEERPAALAYDKLEDYGIFFTEVGDMVSQWAIGPVQSAFQAGLYHYAIAENHEFDLSGKITRGEFAMLAVELYKAMSGEKVYYSGEDPFVDVEAGTTMYTYIMAARDLGIVKGTSTEKKTFDPDALVKRQDAALMLSRVFTKLGGQIPAGASTAFSDNAQIDPYAMDAVAFMSANGIINGRGGASNRFDPKGNASVEEAMKIALEMLNKLDV